jgi:23S rRNA (guanosine2251-2'-O)-methyltransferase
MAKPGRPGAAKGGKGAVKGSGGNNKRRLAGKGPTPKAEDRKKHKAFKLKQAEERKARALGIKTAGKGAGNSKTARELEAAKAKPAARAASSRTAVGARRFSPWRIPGSHCSHRGLGGRCASLRGSRGQGGRCGRGSFWT